jgi:hypothetical protein
MDFLTAFSLSKKYEKLLEPACDFILLVGSMRRAKGELSGYSIDGIDNKPIHDIEFLLIPKLDVATDMFGHPLDEQPPSKLDTLLEDLKASGEILVPKIAKKADGQKFKKFAIPGCNYYDPDERKEKEFCLELWIVNERTVGIQTIIRTGPSTFSYSFVNSEKFVGTHKASGKRLRGLLPHYYEYVPGATMIVVRSDKGKAIDLPTEEAAIGLLGFGYIEPSERFRYVKEEKGR